MAGSFQSLGAILEMNHKFRKGAFPSPLVHPARIVEPWMILMMMMIGVITLHTRRHGEQMAELISGDDRCCGGCLSIIGLGYMSGAL